MAHNCLDENRGLWSRNLNASLGFALARLALEFGYREYETSTVSKADRERMYALPLQDIAKYGAIDVVRPWHIAKHMVDLAKWRDSHLKGRPYRHFLVTVTEVMGRQLQQFVFMERNGLLVDKKYQDALIASGSAFQKQIEQARAALERTPEVQRANEILLRKEGVGSRTLFDTQRAWQFDVDKPLHKQVLFYDVCKLKPIGKTATGVNKVDKEFFTAYRKNPVVRAFSALGELLKLHGTFIVSFANFLVSLPDNRDGRLRTTYKAVGASSGSDDSDAILTGRSASIDPNLQNIPARSAASKTIKRQFVSKRGRLYVKRDFAAHEVRGWVVVSGDPVGANAFWTGMKTRLRYEALRVIPDDKKDWWGKQLTASDIHYQNYGLVYNVNPLVVTKDQRNDFKPTIFSAIYGRGLPALGENLRISTIRRLEDSLDKEEAHLSKLKAELAGLPSHRPATSHLHDRDARRVA